MGNALLFRYKNVSSELPSDFNLDTSYGVWGVYTSYGELTEHSSSITNGDPYYLLSSARYMVMYSNGGYKWPSNFVRNIDWWDKSKLECGTGTEIFSTVQSLLSQYSYVYISGETDRVNYTYFTYITKAVDASKLQLSQGSYEMRYNITYSKGSLIRYAISSNSNRYPSNAARMGDEKEETRWYTKIV